MKKVLFIATFVSLMLLSACTPTPMNMEQFVEEGKRLYKNDSTIEAIVTFNEALAVSDTCKECLLWRAIAYKSINDLNKSLTDLNRLIEIDNQMPQAFANRASIHYLRSDYANALKDYQAALNLKPDFDILYNPLSHMLFVNNRMDEACQYYQLSLQMGDSLFDERIVAYCNALERETAE